MRVEDEARVAMEDEEGLAEEPAIRVVCESVDSWDSDRGSGVGGGLSSRPYVGSDVGLMRK